VITTPGATTGPGLVTVNANGTVAPGTICAAVDDFTTDTCGCTGTTAVESHPGEVRSGQFVPGEVTRAVLATDPDGSTAVAGNGFAACVITVTETAPGATSPSPHSTVVPSADAQRRSLPAGTNVSPAGSTSVITTVGAGTGPGLVTVRV
jgi:hypothetical protein